ncbi:Histone deacetylase 8 [Chamberlinius hualienensis]
MMNFNSGIFYIFSEDYVRICNRGTRIENRAALVHSLIDAYKLTKYMKIVEPKAATDLELQTFHSSEYIEYLRNVNDETDLETAADDTYGYGYDCPLMPKQLDYIRTVAGGTLTAAKCLIENDENHQLIAVNWGGGWHHAKKDEAAGFCYVNDIVLGIIKLLEKYQRVLYVDLDAHHGDGVEDAFAYVSRVMTVSFHKFEEGFYPCSGSVEDTGFGRGKFHSLNIPLKDGIGDLQYAKLFSQVMNEVKSKFNPDVIVCQCGADGLAGDPIHAFNLTPVGLGQCVKLLLQWALPVMFLGGGGYNISNTARCWTYLTSVITGISVSNDIPEHSNLLQYGPGYELTVTPGNRVDSNKEQYLQTILRLIKGEIL